MTAALFEWRSDYQQFTKRAKIKSHLTMPEKIAKKAFLLSSKAINQCCVTFQLILERNLLIFILKNSFLKDFVNWYYTSQKLTMTPQLRMCSSSAVYFAVYCVSVRRQNC